MFDNWYLWFAAMFLVVFFLWLFYGGQKHEFIGFSHLMPDTKLDPDSIAKYDKESADELVRLRSRAKGVDQPPTNQSLNPPTNQPTFDQDQGYKQRSRGETICKKCLESWFKVPFQSERPFFLKNPKTGANLELDCWNKDFRLAVEYNGIQHYTYPNRFHKSEDDLKLQVEKDKYKLEQCNKNGVHLITVPYTVKEIDIPDYIRQRLPTHLRPLAQSEPEI